jgi:PAS domain S-box-containing protein
METSNAEQIQILYEIAFGFDNKASLKSNLRKTLSTILRRMNCSAGSILKRTEDDIGTIKLEHFLSIPKFITDRENIIQLFKNLNEDLKNSGWEKLQAKMPIIRPVEYDRNYYILSLSDFGLMVLEKRSSDSTNKFIKSLQPVLNKLGDSCLHVIHQEELEKQRRRLKSIYSNVPICLYRSSITGTLLMINPAGIEMFGLSEEDDIIYSSTQDFYLDKSSRDDFLKLISEKSVVSNYEVFLKKKNGEKFLASLSANAFRDNENKIIYFEGSIEDITKRKNAEEQLLRAKEAAERSEKLQSEFLAQISHEIRTPINSILNYLSILEDEFKNIKSENSEYSFNVIKNSTYRLLRTIDLVLNISEVEAGVYDMQFEQLDIEKEIINPLITEFEPIAKRKGLQLEFINLSSGSSVLNIDRYTLSQIIVNLINNAIKYTNKGFVKLIIERISEKLIVKVVDSGIGISKEYLPYLFDRFSQEEGGYSRKFEGNGLGLALVKKYCELNDAEINCMSQKGKGTTFTVAFPL